MHQRTGKIGMSVRAPANAACRVACLAAFLVVVSLAEDGLAGVAGRVSTSSSQDQVFRVGRLAPTRGG
jgi:hypothetical protein